MRVLSVHPVDECSLRGLDIHTRIKHKCEIIIASVSKYMYFYFNEVKLLYRYSNFIL